jgi:hypothetical protein
LAEEVVRELDWVLLDEGMVFSIRVGAVVVVKDVLASICCL